MKQRIINCTLSIIFVLAIIAVCVGLIGTLYERSLDKKAIAYITAVTEDANKPYIVAIVRAQSNTVKGNLWFVTLQQDGDNMCYWVHYYKGVWSHETVCTY